jgi:two-component system sensor histidine kinase TctE
LQRELLTRLLVPVLSILLAGGVLSFWGAETLVEKTYDRWLLDAARSLAREVRFEDGRAQLSLHPQAEALVTYDIFDTIRWSVSQGERLVAGQVELPRQGEGERAYRFGAKAYSSTWDGQPVRVGWVPVEHPSGARAEVRVAETLEKRQRAQQELMGWWYAVVGPLLLAAVVIVMVVRRTIAPVERLAADWNATAAQTLDPLPTQGVPRELLPLADALNALIGRLHALLERERQFAGMAAHQLQTPMTALKLAWHRAQRAPDLASAQAALADFGPGVDRLARLVRQLLALSRLDPELRRQCERQQVDIARLAQEVGAMHLDAAAARSIELSLHSPDDGARAVPVAGDEALLAEALSNLLDNALRHAPVGGRVRLDVLADPPTWCVSDDGPGVPAAERRRVFDRFERGSQPVGSGSGLGLAIVREIADLHGAEASVGDSEWGGAAFRLAFPTPPVPDPAA